jgi:hypothetical protein
MSTVLYYRHKGVLVTGRYLRIGPDQYDIAELAELMVARGGVHPGAMVGLVIAAVEGVLIFPMAGVLRVPALWPLALVALVVPCLVGLACARRWPAQYELVARYRGRQVTLFATRNRYEFGQLSRAIRRAMEASYEV